MSNKKEPTARELEKQADALLAAADAAEKAKNPPIMTDAEAKKAGILRLDDKQVAALPAAAWLVNSGNCWRGARKRASWSPRS